MRHGHIKSKASFSSYNDYSISGTFPYMAPEMFATTRRGAAVDIYALGCLYIQLFGGRRVWPGIDGIQIMQKVCGSFGQPPEMPAVSHIPQCFRQVCEECCQLDQYKRPNISHVLSQLTNESK